MFIFFQKGINLFRQNGLLVVTFDTTTSGRNKHLAPVSLFPFLLKQDKTNFAEKYYFKMSESMICEVFRLEKVHCFNSLSCSKILSAAECIPITLESLFAFQNPKICHSFQGYFLELLFKSVNYEWIVFSPNRLL